MKDDDLALLAARLGDALAARGVRLATAESCTGGWISKCLTDRPGCSDWFEYGFVSYGNAAKTKMLAVPAELIARCGAVSREVAEAMAAGAMRASGAEFSVAVTGIAGPGGGTGAKPVGTVWLAWAAAGEPNVCLAERFAGNREEVRRQSVAAALRGALALVERS